MVLVLKELPASQSFQTEQLPASAGETRWPPDRVTMVGLGGPGDTEFQRSAGFGVSPTQGGPALAVGSSGASHQTCGPPDAPPGRGPCGASPVALIEMAPCQLGFFKEMYNDS